MRILVDADVCPVKSEILKVAKIGKLDVVMFIDTAHEINDGYSKVVTVDKGADAVDIKLINDAHNGDIVVTQDFGVASMALAKGAYAINQNGRQYTDENIDQLLFERHIGQKLRKSGKKSTKIKKRTKDNNKTFEVELQKLIDVAR